MNLKTSHVKLFTPINLQGEAQNSTVGTRRKTHFWLQGSSLSGRLDIISSDKHSIIIVIHPWLYRLTPPFHSTHLALCCCFLQGAEAAACPCDLMKESLLERGCREVVLWQTGTGRHKTEEGRQKRRYKNMLLELYVPQIEFKPKIASNKLMEENWWSKVRFREVENTLDNHRRRSTTEEVALSVFKDCRVFFIHSCICWGGTFIPSDCTVLSTTTNTMVLVIYIKLHKLLSNSIKYLHVYPSLHNILLLGLIL